MITSVITNVSGATLTAGSLPGILSWVGDIANNASVTVTLNPHDLTDVVARVGFSLGDLLQQMVQKNKITVAFNSVGATDRDVSVVATPVATVAVTGETYNTGTGASPQTKTHTLAYLPLPGTVAVTWLKYVTVTKENPVGGVDLIPVENGIVLSFVVTLANPLVTDDDLTLFWDIGGGEVSTALVKGIGTALTPTGGAAASIASATIVRATGVLTLVFAGGNAPTVDTIKVTYNHAAASATITDAGDGTWATAGGVSAATINYATKACTITWTGAGVVPYNGNTITVAYTRLAI
jgi:hypothetical protein